MMHCSRQFKRHSISRAAFNSNCQVRDDNECVGSDVIVFPNMSQSQTVSVVSLLRCLVLEGTSSSRVCVFALEHRVCGWRGQQWLWCRASRGSPAGLKWTREIWWDVWSFKPLLHFWICFWASSNMPTPKWPFCNSSVLWCRWRWARWRTPSRWLKTRTCSCAHSSRSARRARCRTSTRSPCA